MPEPRLELLRRDHAPALLAFEQENRAYFAAAIPDRGDAYFADFTARHEALLTEQATGACYFHVLVAGAEILGRLNLVDVSAGSAELGYRIAEKATGRGLATRAVQHLCEVAATDYGLTELRAATTLDNTASATVLTRAGFAPIGKTVLDGQPGTTYRKSLAL
ncbi:GNAT family N-acetyltransferase [Streptomyces sp. A7024]|uniref:GNAT family N-acetyltransferase n=1 Tax=Streptomyces coryli TaxID=1128680 RepID=A0A6G4TZ60_9ACTN|nr:GNAT family N-acetyltransferase [Streptomyces coryli]NGN65265.1 GNAT family N-acetyltransferase [Streptomyces coryli]